MFTKDYAYLSSSSQSWLNHSKAFALESIKDFKLSEKSFVIEVASNDGYLLRNYKNNKIPCLGIEPTYSTAKIARSYGLSVVEKFCTYKNAKEISKSHGKADLLIGNNVFAHVPDINDFTLGIKELLKPTGILSIEFPHLLNLINSNQFDTIYHEHFSYLSLTAVKNIFERAGLKIFNVKELNTHGGSLRVYGCLKDFDKKINASVETILAKEKDFGITNIEIYINHFKKK